MTRKSMDKVSKVARKATWGFALALAFCAMVVSGPVARAQVLYGSPVKSYWTLVDPRLDPRGVSDRAKLLKIMVGTTGFEPATSSTPRMRATRLRHVPTSFARRPSGQRQGYLQG